MILVDRPPSKNPPKIWRKLLNQSYKFILHIVYPKRHTSSTVFPEWSCSAALAEMTLFILTETSAGYALLKAKDKKLFKRNDLASETETAEGISSLYVFQHIRRPTWMPRWLTFVPGSN
jgi:NOP5NT (NUC127) domain